MKKKSFTGKNFRYQITILNTLGKATIWRLPINSNRYQAFTTGKKLFHGKTAEALTLISALLDVDK